MVRAASMPSGNQTCGAVLLTIRVPADFFEIVEMDQSGTATSLLDPDEASGLATWLEQASGVAGDGTGCRLGRVTGVAAPDGTLEEQPLPEASHAAWYRLGPAPGQVGPAVIAGHVDTKSNVAVFFYLSRVRPGDPVVITRADGHTVTFAVEEVRSFPKSNFPTQLVYGPTDYPALRLITCGGPFNRAAGSYLDNIIVFAHMTSHA